MAFLEKTLRDFFLLHNKGEKPFLLGLSGGPDSTALFYLLLQEKIPFEAVHINHGWRQESLSEEEVLKALCADKKVPLHIKRLNFRPEDKNIEDVARRQRQEFYKELLQKKEYQGVILAHQADDVAETVLKRIFEGATLPKLKGLQSKTSIDGVVFYRPLLPITKKRIIEWLDKNQYSYFTDVTNLDPAFLRGRLRTQILPLLSQHFGKEIVPSLARLAQQAAELEEYIGTLLRPYREKIVKEGIFSASIELEVQDKTLFELRMIVKDFIECQGVVPSAASLSTIVQHLCRGRGKKTLFLGENQLVIEKKRLNLTRMRGCQK